MRKFIAFVICVVMMCGFTGCLSRDLEELDTYNGADITSIEGVYYRYTTDKTMNVSGEPQVKQVSLKMVSPVINAEAGTVTVNVQPNVNFPADQLSKLTAENLVVCLNISVASIIRPVDGSVRLGVPGNWSKPNTYEITAADKTKKLWTVTVNLSK